MLQNFYRGYFPRPPLKWAGREGEERGERKGRKREEEEGGEGTGEQEGREGKFRTSTFRSKVMSLVSTSEG
jgi:hypothetical protein